MSILPDEAKEKGGIAVTGAAYVLVKFVTIFLDIVLIGMFVRAILSWFVQGGADGFIGGLAGFLFVVTEPFIMPLRALFNRFGWFQGLPIDMSFMITAMLLSLANLLLSSMIG